MNAKKCVFCENLADQKEIHDDVRFKQAYNVALVIYQWRAGRSKRPAGRTTDYCYRGLGYQLNYCPECGRKIAE